MFINADWIKDAGCTKVDPEMFFQDKRVDEAKEVCSRCPVISECLDYALDAEIKHGTWGGKTAQERKEM